MGFFKQLNEFFSNTFGETEDSTIIYIITIIAIVFVVAMYVIACRVFGWSIIPFR